MGVASFALDAALIGSKGTSSAGPVASWDQARPFGAANHQAAHIFNDVRAKPLPGPPLHVYVAATHANPGKR